MSNHDDFVDEFIEYQIFEESMKSSGGGNSHKQNKGSGCGTTAVIIVLVIIVLAIFGSCSKSNQKSYSSSPFKRSYSTYSSTSLRFKSGCSVPKIKRNNTIHLNCLLYFHTRAIMKSE